MKRLTKEDIEILVISLSYTRRAYMDYSGYPSYDFKQQQLTEVDNLRSKLIQIKKELKQNASKS